MRVQSVEEYSEDCLMYLRASQSTLVEGLYTSFVQGPSSCIYIQSVVEYSEDCLVESSYCAQRIFVRKRGGRSRKREEQVRNKNSELRRVL